MVSKAGQRYADKLVGYINAIGTPASGVQNPDRKDNVGNYLGDIYTWYTVKDVADKKLNAIYKEAQGRGGPLPSDGKMRDNGVGEHMIAESEHFSMIASVNTPAQRFDKDGFIDALIQRFDVDEGKVLALVKEFTKDTTPSLKKRVIIA